MQQEDKKVISFEETKKIELQILANVAAFCEQNNLKYYLAYGTLIGAVRHKGFIPWDDDIDIQMPREDYEKLIQLYNQQENGKFFLVRPGTELSKHSFVKIIDTRTIKCEPGFDYQAGYLGIDVDVFPLDGTPSDLQEYKRWYNKLKSIYEKHLYTLLCYEGSFKHKVKLFVKKFNLKETTYWLEQAQKMHEKYPYEVCEYVASVSCCYDEPETRVEKKCYEEALEMEFEGYKFKVPVGYDKVLRNLYGDYMQLPPKEEQVTHHRNEVFWKL